MFRQVSNSRATKLAKNVQLSVLTIFFKPINMKLSKRGVVEMHCQQSRRKRLVVHTGKMVTRLFAERNFCRKSFFVALRIRERSDIAAKKDGL